MTEFMFTHQLISDRMDRYRDAASSRRRVGTFRTRARRTPDALRNDVRRAG